MRITLSADSGAEFTLDVDYTTFGSYRPARIHGDPDDCYEAEYPEVEVENRARLTLKNGKAIDYDLRKLPERLQESIRDACFKDAMSGGADRDYDGDPHERDDYDDRDSLNVDCSTDNYGRDRDYGKY